MLVRAVLSLSCAVVMLGALYELRDRSANSALILTIDVVSQAEHLADRGRWAEAEWLSDFITDHPHLGDSQRAAALANEARTRQNDFRSHLSRFITGAATGEIQDTASLIGSVSLDLFAIGDVRDLVVQGWKQMHYGTGDEIVIALSAAGLASTLMPHLDWAPALLKAVARNGVISGNLSRSLKIISRKAMQTGDFEALGAVVNDLGSAAVHLGPGPLRTVLPAIANPQELARLVRASRIHARDTYVLGSLFGNRGVRRLHPDGRNLGTLIASVKTSSRVVKVVKKSFGMLPTLWLVAILLIATIGLAVNLRPRLRRHRPTQVRRTPRIEPVIGLATLTDSDSTRWPALIPDTQTEACRVTGLPDPQPSDRTVPYR